MRLLIVGGKLQGTEAAYLAAKAGWETVLVDRREAPPAAGLADVHVIADVTADEARTRSARDRLRRRAAGLRGRADAGVAGRARARRGACRCCSTSTPTG